MLVSLVLSKDAAVCCTSLAESRLLPRLLEWAALDKLGVFDNNRFVLVAGILRFLFLGNARLLFQNLRLWCVSLLLL